MNDFVSNYQYVVAWMVYLVSGLFVCVLWWRLTRPLPKSDWRDLLRGIVVVLLFTPWFATGAHEHYAPALMVALMDRLLESTANGLAAFVMLFGTCLVTLILVIVRRLTN